MIGYCQFQQTLSDHLNIADLSRYALDRHYAVQAGWDSPGFFVGNVSNLEDLVCHWNLRAADIALWFVDLAHIGRYADMIPAWEMAIRQSISHRHESNHHIAVWSSHHEDLDRARQAFPGMQLKGCPLSEHSWSGESVRPPVMSFDQFSVLGVFGRENGKPKVSFALSNKPFCGDTWFHTQHLVASVSFIGGLYGDEQYTLKPPYLPELNEFYARMMNFHYSNLRIESERIGIVIDAADTDAWLYALPITELINRIFGMAGYEVKLSNGGLITRQLISQLGGLQGARIFKIPGVRRLLKTYSPTTSFTKNVAIQLIKNKDSKDPNARFSDHLDLHIEKRPAETQLKADDVFVYMVEKGLFRIGVELTCPSCRMADWIAVDTLKQSVVCDLCGYKYDATRQLINGELHYRRSGVMGAERNAQGAIPVALTLQQLETNLASGLQDGMYSPSLDLTREGETCNECEVDFVWVIPRRYPKRTAIILGECKDQGPIKLEEFEKDIQNLRRVADALPYKRFKTFILLAKLNPFTQEEIELAKTLNTEHQLRVILLTSKELEPYHIYERIKTELDTDSFGRNPEELARTTNRIYFCSLAIDTRNN